MRKFHQENKGVSILGIIFFGFIIIVVLSYFNISIKSVINNPSVRDNFNYVAKVSTNVWNNYLERPAKYVWKLFLSGIKEIRNSNILQPPDTSNLIPKADPAQ